MMRDSAVPDPLIGAVLGLSDTEPPQAGAALRQRLDYAERPLRSGPPRDREARAELGYALKQGQATWQAAIGEGRDPLDDPASLRAMVRFIQAQAECWRVESAAGADVGAWLPLYMRADPVAEAEAEIDGIRQQIEDIELTRQAEAEAERVADRSAARRALTGVTTMAYSKLSAAERSEWEQYLGLDLPAERAPASDALSRLPISLDLERGADLASG